MTHASENFSLLDAVRVLARGGALDAKLRVFAEQSRIASGGSSATLLLFDAEGGLLTTLDGRISVPVTVPDGDLAAVLRDRRPLLATAAPAELEPMAPHSGRLFLAPLVVEDEVGIDLEGLLVVAAPTRLENGNGEREQVLALADLAAVAIRQARLQNAVAERSDYADRLAHTDRLTGLADRVTFERMLELEIARATRQGTALAVAVFDVDGLTEINDRQGAGAGDDVLRSVASALADRVRLLDTVARIGDDEFGVIAPGDAGGIVARRLRDAIAELPPVGTVRVSVSAAVVHHPDDGATGAELVAASEAAIARAREAGPGAVIGSRQAG